MKLATFKNEDGRQGFGVVERDTLAVIGGAGGGHWPSLKALLADGGAEAVRPLLPEALRIPLSEVAFAPVIPDPDIVFCVGLNYSRHIAEMGREMPKYPSLFSRTARSQVGHGAAMVVPHVSPQLDYEGELAVVIGKGGRYIGRDAALSHVAGFSCYNDGSIRDFQRHTTQFMPGKNFWATGAFGPWLVTPDEFGPVAFHRLVTRLNGQVMQETGLDDLLFDVPSLIAYISSFTEIRCGDVIITGTPGGVGTARKPPVYMKPGDVVEVEIDGIGVLRNPVIAESAVRVAGDVRI